jgi:hypothetical protein
VWHHDDYLPNDVTTPFATFQPVNGTVSGRCMLQPRHREFIRFLNALGRAVSIG